MRVPCQKMQLQIFLRKYGEIAVFLSIPYGLRVSLALMSLRHGLAMTFQGH